jgi:SMODS-associating 2TM, beta-strand rich effector domain
VARWTGPTASAVAAALLALLTDWLVPSFVLRLYVVALSVAVLFSAAYRVFLWRWRLVREFTGMPLLDGTWRGTLLSSYADTVDEAATPIPVALLITQTWSSVVVTLFTAESSSVSRTAELVRLADRRWSLTWFYENIPRPSLRGRSERHRGMAEATISVEKNATVLLVEYFTDRLTAGEMRLVEWSPSRYGTHDSAFQATNFYTPRPFVRSEV